MATSKKNNNMTPAVIYARYSSHGQTEQSIEGQLRDCYAFAEREGYAIVSEYIDRAISGTGADNRPDFQRMIGDAAKKQFAVIIVWKLDRFARNRYDSATYKMRLKKHGVKVVSATENISDNPEGIILEGMLESMAEYYSANLAQNVKRGQRESLLKGHYLGGSPPIGYKIVDKKLVIDENKVHIIRRVFEEYARGISKKEILAELTAKGITNTNGKPLTSSCFQHALKNEKYIGIYRFNGEEVPGGCPAIIDKKTFLTVQNRLAEHRKTGAASTAKTDYLLHGKAFCGNCGTRMVGEYGRGKGGGMFYYYSCGKRKRYHSCNKKSEKKGFLEWYVVEQTLEYVLNKQHIDFIAGRVVAAYNDEFSNKRIKECEKLIAKLDADINKLIDTIVVSPAKAAGRITEKIELLELQKNDLEVDLSRLKIANEIRYTKSQIVAWLKSFCDGDLMDEKFQRKIIDVFINSVYVYDDKIVIYYNIHGGKQVSYVDMLDSTEELDENNGDGVRALNRSPCSRKASVGAESAWILAFLFSILFSYL